MKKQIRNSGKVLLSELFIIRIFVITYLMGYSIVLAQNPKVLLPTPIRAEDGFGYPVSVSGNIMATSSTNANGVNQGEGRVNILYKDAGGLWKYHLQIEHPNPDINQRFGISLSLDGNDLLVGSYGPNYSGGKSFIFSKDQGGIDNWGLVKEFNIDGSYSYLKIEGDIAVIGSKVHYRNLGGANNWGEVATLTASSQKGIDIDGDYIFIGNQGYDNIKGKVFIYGRNQGGPDNWGFLKSIQPAGIPDGSRFGFSLSSSNDLLVVSAYDESTGPLTKNGAIYFYKKDQGGVGNWGFVQKIDGPSSFGWFGITTQIVGDHLYAVKSNNSSNDPFNILTYKINGTQDQWIFQNEFTLVGTRNVGGISPMFFVTPNQELYFSDWGNNEFGQLAGRVLNYNENVSGSFSYSLDQQIFPTEVITGYVDFGYGFSSSINGDWAGVVAREFGGSKVFVFNRYAGGDDFWGNTQKIEGFYIANEVVIIGNYMIVSDPFVSYGKVYIYKLNSGQWALLKTLDGNGYVGLNQRFGYSISFDGNTLVIGNRVGVNSVFIFYKDLGGSDNFGFVKSITPFDGQSTDEFADQIVVDNSTLIVSAFYDDVGTLTDAGSIYIYNKNVGGTDNWGFVKKINGTTQSKGFGGAISLYGDYCWVANINDGNSFLFERNQGGSENWGIIKSFSFNNYGESGQVTNNYIVLGQNSRCCGFSDVHVIHRDQGGLNNWGEVYSYQSTNTGDYFGFSVTSTENEFIVGAPKLPPGNYRGQAYLFGMPPVAPIINPAASITQTSFDLSWNAGLLADSYKIDISTDPGFSTFIPGYNNLGTTQQGISVSGLSAGLTYYVRIRSVNASATSFNSASLEITTLLPTPPIPTALEATSISSESFMANWSAVSEATHYLLDVSNDNFSSFLTGYNAKSVTATTELISGLAPGDTYSYRVRASNGTDSPNSDIISVRTLPSKPTALSVNLSDVTASSFKASWSPALGVDKYELEVSEDDFLTLVANYDPKEIVNATEEVVIGLKEKTAYKYRVRARNTSGYSAYSNTVSIETKEGSATVLLTIIENPRIRNDLGMVLSATVSGGSGERVVRFYSKGILSMATWSEVVLTSFTNNFEVTVLFTELDDIGLEYYFEAIDGSTNSPIETEHGFIYQTRAANELKVPNLSFGGKRENYRIISIPNKLEDNLVQSIFGVLGDYDKTKWRLVRYQNNKNEDFPAFNRIEQGKGYWFNSVENVEIKLGAGTSPENNQGKPFVLALAAGWNQIGNPYPFDVSWNDVLALNGNPTTVSGLYTYNSSNISFNKDVAILKAWEGGFVRADQAVNLTIPVTVKQTGGRQGRRNEIAGKKLDDSSWFVPITVAQGVAINQLGGFGMHPEASRSKDKFDEHSLPRFLNYLELNAYHNEYFMPKFTGDVVPTSENYTWDFVIESNFEGPATQIQWDNLSLGVNEAQLLLVDVAEHVIVDMKMNSYYVFSSSAKREFKVLFAIDEKHLQPQYTTVGKPYPNPFTSLVTLPILSAGNGHLQVAVYDMMGKQVKLLLNDVLPQGLHEVVWDGRDEQGSKVASGVYIYNMKVAGGPLQYGRLVVK